MKKLLTAIAMFIVVTMTGCSTVTEESVAIPEVEHTTYFMSGRYYFDADLQGQVLTEDGNIWGYTQDIISEEPSYNNQPVIVLLDDNGTPDMVEDDVILGLVFDRETAIYDELETVLSESFELDRDGNNIRIQTIKEEN